MILKITRIVRKQWNVSVLSKKKKTDGNILKAACNNLKYQWFTIIHGIAVYDKFLTFFFVLKMGAFYV